MSLTPSMYWCKYFVVSGQLNYFSLTWWFVVVECRKNAFAKVIRVTQFHLGVVDGRVFDKSVGAVSWSKVSKGQVTGHRSRGDNHRHHQQHVLRDSEACRPSLKPFPEVPAASTTGMRLPVRRHLHSVSFTAFSLPSLFHYHIHFYFKMTPCLI